jgi:hypothetical protein
MPHVFADLPPAATQAWTQTSDIMADYNSPEAMAARFAGYAAEEKAERAAHLAKLNEEGAAEREELRQRPRIMIPPGEEMTIEEANAFVARKRNGNIKAPADPTDNNDPANVIRHLPTPEELLEHNPAPTGKDVL